MRNKRIWLLIVLMPISVLLSKAQPNLSLFPFENQFNSSDFNPAFLTSSHKFTFSFFPIGGTTLSYNNPQVISSLFSKISSGITTDKDYQDIMESMANRPTIHQNLSISLLNFTFHSKVGFLNFRIKEVENFSASIKGELTDLIALPGFQSTTIGKSQYLPAQGMHYREYSLAFALPPKNHKFSAGIRAKLYFGKASFFSGLSGSIQNVSDDYFLKTEGKINMSVPELKVFNEDGTSSLEPFKGKQILNYLVNHGNYGVGIDLGIKYKITPNLSVSLSVLDFGKINWKSKLNSRSFDVNFLLNSDSIISELNSEGNETITKKYPDPFIERVSKNFIPVIDRSTSFSGKIPVSIYAGLKYYINPAMMLSLVDNYVLIEDMNYNCSAFLASMKINKTLSVSTGFSIIGKSYLNIPLTALIEKDFGQIYFGTDNLVAFLVPSGSNFSSFSIGTCFYLFKRKNNLLDKSDNFPFYQPQKINIRKNKGTLN